MCSAKPIQSLTWTEQKISLPTKTGMSFQSKSKPEQTKISLLNSSQKYYFIDQSQPESPSLCIRPKFSLFRHQKCLCPACVNTSFTLMQSPVKVQVPVSCLVTGVKNLFLWEGGRGTIFFFFFFGQIKG